MYMIENIEYSEEWLIKELIKTDIQQKQTGKIEYVTIAKINLIKMFQEFIKLNKRGGV